MQGLGTFSDNEQFKPLLPQENLILTLEKGVAMYSDARKMHLIEEVIKTNNEAVLIKLESVLKKASKTKDQPRPSAHDLVGLWSKSDAELVEKAIQEGCEQINPDAFI